MWRFGAILASFRGFWQQFFLSKIAKNLVTFLAIFRKAKILISDHRKQLIFTLDVYILGLKLPLI